MSDNEPARSRLFGADLLFTKPVEAMLHGGPFDGKTWMARQYPKRLSLPVRIAGRWMRAVYVLECVSRYECDLGFVRLDPGPTSTPAQS